MDKPIFHHALKVDTNQCIGCSHCMRACPTEAIRVWGGKAVINDNRCIDCGECYRVCPVQAIYIEQDDFEEIFKYKHRVVLFPSVLIGQFSDDIPTGTIYGALKDLGFTDVFEVEHGVEILHGANQAYVDKNKENKPLISAFCPSIVRLIQVKYPALVDNIVLLNSPSDISAKYYKQKLIENGAEENEIGIFYITPCASKITAIKSPVGEDNSEITGVINIDFIYNKIRNVLKSKTTEYKQSVHHELSPKGVLWSLTNGEAANVKGRTLSIDGIQNAIEFLEKVENEEITNVDFIEIRSCDEGCAGGILNHGNRFLTAERLINRAYKIASHPELDKTEKDIFKYESYLLDHIGLKKISPRSMYSLDTDISEAIEKMKKSNKLLSYLPGFDCGACGAPSCKALAEDIAQEDATLSHCVFMQRVMEKHHKLSPQNAIKIIEKVWGVNCLNKDNSRTAFINDDN